MYMGILQQTLPGTYKIPMNMREASLPHHSASNRYVTSVYISTVARQAKLVHYYLFIFIQVFSISPETIGVRVDTCLHLCQQHSNRCLSFSVVFILLLLLPFILPWVSRQRQQQRNQRSARRDSPQQLQQGPVQGHMSSHIQNYRERIRQRREWGKPLSDIRKS